MATSSAGITFGGLSSGIDTESIISRLEALSRRPITNLQKNQETFKNRGSAYSALSGYLGTLNSAASTLSIADSFRGISASSSSTDVATIVTSSGATAGSYKLVVNNLATANKVSSAAQSDVTSALGLSGKFVINGTQVTVTATDSLGTIAKSINSLNNGVTASLIDGGSGAAYLTLTSNSTGFTNKVQVADTNGGVLSSLGLLQGSATVREPITKGATSFAVKDQTSSLASLGGWDATSGSIQINGQSVAIDTSTDSLQGVAQKINQANISGVTASVQSVTNNGKTTYKLNIVGNSSTPTFTDSNNILTSMGLLQQGFGTQLIEAKDASYSLDGIALKSASNTITSAIPNGTLTLLKDTVTSNGTTSAATSTITLSKDTAGIKDKVNAFVSAFNSLKDFINQNSTFDDKTYESGVLFGDAVARQVDSELAGRMFDRVPGLTGDYTNLAAIGLAFDDKGKLTLDDAKLTTAVENAGTQVAALFNASGSGSTNALNYVSSSAKTKASITAPYNVNITQLATKGSYTGELAQTSATTSAEVLTFSGNAFANTSYQLTIPSGSTASDIVALINADVKTKDVVTASLDQNGKLRLDGKKYGTSGNFTAVSNITAASDNSGLGVGSLGTTVAGADIAGTINGEEATGSGQFLTGKSGAANVDGLQIQYTGNTTGAVGTMNVTLGMGSIFTSTISLFTDSTNGYVKAANDALTNQSSDIDDQIAKIDESVKRNTETLRLKFAAMDKAIASYQSHASQLASLNNSTSR